MEISNHVLFKNGTQVEFIESPNTNGPSNHISPSFLIIHYTAGSKIDGALSHFRNRSAEASAHIIIGRDGRVVQMVPFNQKAWHAGNSHWGNITGLNRFSIGIELVNAGKLMKKDTNYVTWSDHVIPNEEVIQATHKHETSPAFWHQYTQAQFDAAVEVSKAIIPMYSIMEILGHDDIAPGRKTDPGPAFPMTAFISSVFGRS